MTLQHLRSPRITPLPRHGVSLLATASLAVGLAGAQGVAPLAAGAPVAPGTQPTGPEAPLPPGGIATYLSWGDFNSDGLDDAWLLLPDGTGRLAENNGLGGFVDVTARVGLSGLAGAYMGLFADYDGDGAVDLLLPAWRGPTRLMRQGADGQFTDVMESAGLPADCDPIDARWLDFDDDGAPDLHLVTLHDELLFHNVGGGAFEEVELAGVPRLRLPFPGQELPPTVDAARAVRGIPGTASANGGVTSVSVTPLGPGVDSPGLGCVLSIQDVATGGCLMASSVPQLGLLYPISNDLYVDATTGFVGMGTTTPSSRLTVAGDVSGARLISTIGTDTPPITVASRTIVPLLNADFLDGLHAVDFRLAGSPITGTDILDGSISSLDIATDAVGADALGDSSVDSAAIIDGTIASADIGVNSIDSSKVINGSLVGADIAMGSIGQLQLAANSVGASQIETGAVGSLEIAAAAVGMSEIANGSITNLKVSFNSADRILGAKIRPDFIGDVTGGNFVALNQVRPARGTLNDPTLRFGLGDDPTGISNPFPKHLALVSDGFLKVLINETVTSFRNILVGIGTQSPTSILHVAGSASVGDFGRFSTHGFSSRLANNNSSVDTAMFGSHEGSSGYRTGVYGRTSSSGGFGVFSEGDFGATGTKSFVQRHPSDPSRQINFVCLEGNESGTYFRGKIKLRNGRAVIVVPEDFRLVSDEENLTVQLTATGRGQVWVERYGLDQVIIAGERDVEVHYIVNGVRRGYADVATIRENTGYRPRVRGQEFGTQYPQEIRDMLVENGILNLDHTPNAATAAALGWSLVDAEEPTPAVQPPGVAADEPRSR